MSKKKIFLAALFFLIVSGAWYGLSEYNRKPADLKKKKADYTVNTPTLLKEFEQDKDQAGSKYFDKILAVTGIIKAIEKNETGEVTVILSREEDLSSVRCSVDDQYTMDAEGLNPGMEITVRGAFTGFNDDELLGSDVFMNRCVILD